MAEAQEESKKITITVKTPKEKQQVEIEEDADIKRVSRSRQKAYSWRNNIDIIHAIGYCSRPMYALQ